MYLIIFSAVTCFLIYVYFSRIESNNEKILGIYSSTGGRWYCLKYYAMLVIFFLRKLRKSGAGSGIKVEDVEQLEKIQQLSSHEKAFDAVFYHGVGKDNYFFVGGMERRHKGKVNGLIYFVIPEIGLLHSEKLPKTELDADPVSLQKSDSFAGEGISFTPVQPMKLWKISYSGKMWSGEEDEKKWHDVVFEAEFTSNFPHFVTDTDLDKKALARAMARETWSKEFFNMLQNAHQIHYEQMGFLKGTLIIDGHLHNINMMSFRDHSFGNKRDWTMLHRYIFHMFYLDNGIRISCGVISHPSSLSHFEIGHIVYPNGTTYSIQSCDLKLYQHAERGNLPTQLAFSFTANNENFDCRIKYLHNSVHYKGNDREAKLYERFFVSEVNGMKGNGISEWQYNNVGTYTKR